MADRDWDAEMRKIDEQMARAAKQAPPAAAPSAPPVARPAAATGAPGLAALVPSETKGWAVYLRLTLAVALGVGIIFWPYAARCGIGLAGYLGAVSAVIVGGVWSAVWTWRHRAARAHLLSLLLVLWGLVLAGVDVLPRTGYALPTETHPAGWRCG
jgi:hypothetical protein